MGDDNNIILPPPARLDNIVVLRSIATMAVVLYHCYCPWIEDLWNWVHSPASPIYSFVLSVVFRARMPLFVFVSGYLFAHLILDRGKYTTFGGFVKNKVERLLIPFFIFGAIMCLFHHHNYWNIILFPKYHLWFLEMLFWCFISGWLLNKFVQNTLLRLLFFGGAVAMTRINGTPLFAFGAYCLYFVFFYGGYLFYAYRDKLRFVFNRSFSAGLLCGYLTIIIIALGRGSLCDTFGIENGNRIYAYSMSLLNPISILLALIAVEYYLHTRAVLPSFFTQLNNLSYGIYLIHHFLLEMVHKYFWSDATALFFESHYIILPPILFAVVFSLSIAICRGLKRYRWSKWVIG